MKIRPKTEKTNMSSYEMILLLNHNETSPIRFRWVIHEFRSKISFSEYNEKLVSWGLMNEEVNKRRKVESDTTPLESSILQQQEKIYDLEVKSFHMKSSWFFFSFWSNFHRACMVFVYLAHG